MATDPITVTIRLLNGDLLQQTVVAGTTLAELIRYLQYDEPELFPPHRSLYLFPVQNPSQNAPLVPVSEQTVITDGSQWMAFVDDRVALHLCSLDSATGRVVYRFGVDRRALDYVFMRRINGTDLTPEEQQDLWKDFPLEDVYVEYDPDRRGYFVMTTDAFGSRIRRLFTGIQLTPTGLISLLAGLLAL